jgi:hypothetical protein
MQAQLEAAQRRMEACPQCSTAARDAPVNPVVLMRQMRAPRVGEAPESSDESSEFVDVDLDGVRAAPNASPAVSVTVLGDTPGSSKSDKRTRRKSRDDDVAGDALPANEAKAIAELLKLSAEKVDKI